MEKNNKLEQAKESVKYLQDRISNYIKELENTINYTDNGIDLSAVKMHCNDIYAYAENLNYYTKDCILTIIFDNDVDMFQIKEIDGVIDVLEANENEFRVITKQCFKYYVLNKLHELGEMEYHDETIQ